MKSKIISVVSVALSTAIVLSVAYRHEYYKHKEPPPSYSIVKDDVGNFFVKQAKEPHTIFNATMFVNRSKQEAINLAWDFDNFDKHPDAPEYTPIQGELHEVSCSTNLEKGGDVK